jgi:hypothetical protein
MVVYRSMVGAGVHHGYGCSQRGWSPGASALRIDRKQAGQALDSVSRCAVLGDFRCNRAAKSARAQPGANQLLCVPTALQPGDAEMQHGEPTFDVRRPDSSATQEGTCSIEAFEALPRKVDVRVGRLARCRRADGEAERRAVPTAGARGRHADQPDGSVLSESPQRRHARIG